MSRNYIGKTFNAIINILKNNPNGKAEDINTNSSTSKWEKKDNKWYYYEDGNMVTGWKLVDGKWYYLESNGVMAIGWKELGGIWYYLNESGAMVKGWQTISGKTYYFNDSGHMLVGKQVIDGRNYNFNTSGQLDSTNWVKSNNNWYYYENGKMITGWKLINGEWYYLEGSGVMATGWKELGGIWYYLNESGAMVKGWQTISGKTYYFNDSGHMLLGKQTIDGKSYEFNGSGQLISDTGDISLSESTYIATGEVIDVQTILNVRKGPGTNYDSIGQLHQGDKVSIVAKNGEWYKISSPIAGYVHSEFIEIYSENNISNERIIDTTPDKLLKSITMNIEGVDIEFEWRLMPHDNKYHLMPVNELRNLEKYHHAFALQVSFGELVSFVLSLTPVDFAKDLIEFIAGKDIITGEKYDRVTLGTCLLLPEFSEVLVKKGVKGAGPVARIFKASFKRAQPGIVEGAELLKSYEKISRGQGHIILIPKEVGIKLQGKKFKDFNEFRSEFWKEMSKSKYAKEFSKNNISNMSKGNAPIAVEEQWLGSRSKYELHHKKPIWDGGDVYNLDNLVIVSPRYHQEILDKDYHFQRGEFKID
ncbi:SH3 domain-containing protein [Clostridium perfringens]|uniref:SH3 domain-containing protein n=1 Tax=Clostridium perfringens TaxID=1502 RepID=UPI00311AA868